MIKARIDEHGNLWLTRYGFKEKIMHCMLTTRVKIIKGHKAVTCGLHCPKLKLEPILLIGGVNILRNGEAATLYFCHGDFLRIDELTIEAQEK
jgi:hypothetical protein